MVNQLYTFLYYFALSIKWLLNFANMQLFSSAFLLYVVCTFFRTLCRVQSIRRSNSGSTVNSMQRRISKMWWHLYFNCCIYMQYYYSYYTLNENSPNIVLIIINKHKWKESFYSSLLMHVSIKSTLYLKNPFPTPK